MKSHDFKEMSQSIKCSISNIFNSQKIRLQRIKDNIFAIKYAQATQ